MFKSNLIKLASLFLAAVSVSYGASSEQPIPVPLAPGPVLSQKVEVWYPVFFKEYSADKVQEIINNAKAGKVDHLVILYDQNQSLAQQISAAIAYYEKVPIELKQQSVHTGASADADPNRVVVDVYGKSEMHLQRVKQGKE